MSREIKYRAWDTIHHEMIPDSTINLQRAYSGMFRSGGNWIPLEYIGLTDLNGVEIYEGDVVEKKQGRHIWRYKVVRSDYFKTLEGQTFWRNFYFDNNPDINDYRFGDTFTDDGGCNLPTLAKGIVIGNIYENPELLGEGDAA
ncbi:YopX family protein [Mycolicibacterium neoaurum]|uniref:YopX family protein n=1 Tax=Mycolicibacterium neoaurum TaxID=1795 RepID=UPI001F4C7EE7|nr:YopX family protein [Mycolicibacterium neoaurum]